MTFFQSDQFRNWLRRPSTAVLLLTLCYLLYLPISGYSQLYYDADTYWGLPTRFITSARHFSLLEYSVGGRGYSWPLLLVPLRTTWKLLGGEPIWYTRLMGAVLAGLVFGWLGPHLYQRLTGAAVWAAPGRRAAFALVGFICWRDYFNFPLSDFPALFALGCALLLVLRPRLRWPEVVGLGALLGLALNIRPIYQLSAGVALVAALWPASAADSEVGSGAMAGRAGGWQLGRLRRVPALLLGLVLVLGSQYAMNRRHFPQESPWQLAGNVRQNELVAKHLSWGLGNFKYETNIGTDYPGPRVLYPDPVGQTLLRREHPSQVFGAQSQYWELVRRHPLLFARLYLRRLFDGLDIQYPTPYIRQIYTSSWPLALVNYTVLLLGIGRLLAALLAGARPNVRQALVLLALVLPCLGSLPMAVEVRFMLPLHLLLAAAATLGWPQKPVVWEWVRTRPGRALLLSGLFGLALLGCFRVSADTQAHLEHGARLPSGQRGPVVENMMASPAG